MAQARELPNTSLEDEIALLQRLLALDVAIRTNPDATHVGSQIGDGLITYLHAIIARVTGVDVGVV